MPAAAAAGSVAAAAAVEATAGCGAAQQQALAFVQCVAASPLLLSALLSLELACRHPPAEAAADGPQAAAAAACEGLEWTLAQVLALHLRAGCHSGELVLAGPANGCTAVGAAGGGR